MNRQGHPNLFDFYLHGLGEEASILLQLLHDLRGATFPDLEFLLRISRVDDFRQVCIGLEDLGLLFCDHGVWTCTWIGAGVANWRQQLCWAAYQLPGGPIPAPRPGENGSELGPPCSEFRPTLFAPGYCWCCRAKLDHASEVLRVAERIISR